MALTYKDLIFTTYSYNGMEFTKLGNTYDPSNFYLTTNPLTGSTGSQTTQPNTCYSYEYIQYGVVSTSQGTQILNIQWPSNRTPQLIYLYFRAGGGNGGAGAIQTGGGQGGNGGSGGSGNLVCFTINTSDVQMGQNNSTQLFGLTITSRENGFQFEYDTDANDDTIFYTTTDNTYKYLTYGNIYEQGDANDSSGTATLYTGSKGVGRGQTGAAGQYNGVQSDGGNNNNGGTGGYGLGVGLPGYLLSGGWGYTPVNGAATYGTLYDNGFFPTGTPANCAIITSGTPETLTSESVGPQYLAYMPMLPDGAYTSLINGKYYLQSGFGGLANQAPNYGYTPTNNQLNGCGGSQSEMMLFWQQN